MLFREIGMEAPSPPQMLAFYGEMLGLPSVAEDAEEVAVRAGATVLRFRSAPPGTVPTYHFALRVPATRLLATPGDLGKHRNSAAWPERGLFRCFRDRGSPANARLARGSWQPV